MSKKIKYRNVNEIDVSTNKGKEYYNKICASAPVNKTNGDIVAAQAFNSIAGANNIVLNHILERLKNIESSLYVKNTPTNPGVVPNVV